MNVFEKTSKGKSPFQRFCEKVLIGDGCWNWQGFIDPNGYSRISHYDKNVLAHRVSWLIHNGKIPQGKCVLHKCDNPVCTRPSHLFLGTFDDNNKDRSAKGRSARGETHGHAKLTWDAVKDIRTNYIKWPQGSKGNPRSLKYFADKYNVPQSSIIRILSGESWKEQ
jgi:hypothetical protein